MWLSANSVLVLLFSLMFLIQNTVISLVLFDDRRTLVKNWNVNFSWQKRQIVFISTLYSDTI